MCMDSEDKHNTEFLDFANTQSAVNAVTAIENFIIGFRLGVRIGIEVMDGEDSVLQDVI